MSVACILKGLEAPRPKALPLSLLASARGTEPLPQELTLRSGAQELLQCHPSARPLIVDAFRKIKEVFGDATRVALDRFVDPEEPRPEAWLYLVIGTELPATDARNALDRFFEEWWVDNVDRGQGRVHISLEFL